MSHTDVTTCCIVGGGPAGMFLGYLLARAGVRVTVLEKHSDFLRDFRGDTIHPSTMQLLAELDLLEEFLPIVDFRADTLYVNIDGKQFRGPTFKHLNVDCPFIGFAPQWDFLNLMSSRGKHYSEFNLRMATKATDVIRQQGRVVGVRWESYDDVGEIRADLVVAADGRSSTIRNATEQAVEHAGIPIDVLWFRLDRPLGDSQFTLAWIKDGHMLVTIPRRDHYQTAMVISKGAYDTMRRQGLDRFRWTIGNVCPPLAEVAQGLRNWDQVKLLTVQMNRLKTWHKPGLVFIGDAAHAMSPVGGVGINLAIQDAVAAANLLVGPLRTHDVDNAHLAALQHRRERAARRTQQMQAFVHSALFADNLAPGRPFSPSWPLRHAVWLLSPLLRNLAGRWIGIGFQPEHIGTEDVHNVRD